MWLGLILVLAYLIGSFPTAIIVGKVLKGIDIRDFGSGNAGATNVFRVLGWKAGLLVMLVDVFKGFFAAYWLPQWLPSAPIDFTTAQLLAGCAAVCGHIWTIFAGFRGGKGVGTAAGMLLALFPYVLFICLGIFLIVFALTRIVSISSIIAAISFPIVLTIFRYLLHIAIPLPLYLFSFMAAALIIFTHRSNIRRLLAGKENRFNVKKKTSLSI